MHKIIIASLALLAVPLVAHAEPAAVDEFPSVLPEITSTVDLSSSDVNRVACKDEIRDVVYSKEKGVRVEIRGRDAFVKFLINKKGDGDLEYATTPSELFVICGQDTFPVIAIPKRIPSQTVRLISGKGDKIKKNIALTGSLPLEKKIMGIIKGAYTEDIPDSYTITPSTAKFDIFKDLSLTLRRTISVEGEGLQLKEYSAELVGEIPLLQLREKDFLRPELAHAAVAVSIDILSLRKGERSRIFIVERRGVDER